MEQLTSISGVTLLSTRQLPRAIPCVLLVCALALPLIAGRRAAAQSLPDTTLPASTSQPSTNPTGFAPEAAPENSSDNEPDSDNGTSSDDAAPQTPLSADQIIAILQQNPDLLADLKSEVAGQMQQQGMTVDPASISDQALYREISSNADLRASISQVLRARGYGTSELSPPSPSATRESDLNLSSSQGGMESETGPWSGMNRAANATSLAGADEALAAHRSGEMQRESSRRREPANASTDLPRVVQEPAPYDLQALHDLYQQFPDETSPLHRFGAEVFVNRATSAMGRGSTARDTPLDVPLGPDYVVGPGDQLTIELWGGVTQSITRAVGRDGSIFLPEAGALQVAGLPLGTVQNLIGGALQRQYRDAQVAVTVSRLRSVRIYVVGDIQRPGGYDVSSLATPVSLLYAAGGPTAAGSLRTALHERGDRLIEKIDLYDFLLHGVRKGSAPFQSGDTLVVPPAGPLVAVTGAVRRPAIYELNDTEASLASVIEDAGGFTAAASLSHIRIERIDPHRQRETVTLDRSGRSASETQPPAVAALRVQDGDRIRVEPILPYSQRAIYLAGHVVRPGRLPYTQDMHVSDVLRSYRDVLPEPADRAEIVRLVPPDLHAETIEFSLPDVLAGHAQISLLPFDTIRVFGRYQLDAPMVTIRGQVLRPGTYPMSRGMTAAQLVRMAGGFRRDALRARADLTSYQVDNGNRIAELLSTVRIGDAVEGSDPQADVPLKPGDILSIHQITSWDDIGESVTIQGQVRYPGSYGFTDGEKLSSVLRRAGGLLPTAYPAGAVLVRVQVKQEEENSREELIRQIETNSAAARLSPTAAAGGNAAGALQLIKAQEDQVLSNLKAHPPGGRMVIHMTADIDSWANSPADIELRRGDVLTIPKRPGFVLVTGQVYNATALSFAPGRTAEWYLGRAGGTNSTANRKEIFIIRANGSVVGRHSGGWLGGSVLATRLQPGDIVVVPQKILGGSLFWRNLLSTGQLAASVAITAGVAAAAL